MADLQFVEDQIIKGKVIFIYFTGFKQKKIIERLKNKNLYFVNNRVTDRNVAFHFENRKQLKLPNITENRLCPHKKEKK